MEERRAARFRLVTAAHTFLATTDPFPSETSPQALRIFLAAARSVNNLTAFDAEAVLLRLAAILDGRLNLRPTLVERYQRRRRLDVSPLECFGGCIEDALHYFGVPHPAVMRAIAIIEESFHNPTFGPRQLADRTGTRPDVLARLFEKVVGVCPSDYLRNVRIERAADLLSTTRGTSKEVWVSVGYNHASNLCHDFKRRFGMTPLEFRDRQIRVSDRLVSTGPILTGTSPKGCADQPDRHQPVDTIKILVIDDDVGTRANLCAYFQRRRHYSTQAVETGIEGVHLAVTERPDVILLDYHLPDVDGLECVSQLRLLGVEAPVIIFSADCDLEELGVDLATRGALFLSKLADLEMIEEHVKSAMASRAACS
jgi:AraC-like DNA-binding protein/ActR/RegA family two-component response regulator